MADVCAGEAARAERRRGASDAEVSLTFLKMQRSHRAAMQWREEIVRRAGRSTPFVIPPAGARPCVPAGVRRAPKHLAFRFFQLYSEHAMLAPFLRGRLGWVESEGCWCGGTRQTREHLFKECLAWKPEIRILWRRVGETSGGTVNVSGHGRKLYKGRKGFGLGISGGAGPGDTSVKRLLADTRFTEAFMDFLRTTKEWNFKRELYKGPGKVCWCFCFFLFLLSGRVPWEGRLLTSFGTSLCIYLWGGVCV